MTEIRLPSHVFEHNIPDLVSILFKGEDENSISLDFSRVKYYIPAGVTLVLSVLRRFIDRGQLVQPLNYESNDAFRYLQRIDFFRLLGLNIPENFRRHDSVDFMPLQEIQPNITNIAEISSRVARCLMPHASDNDCFQLLEYSCGEVIGNCKQHSGGIGYMSAQYAQNKDLARIAISDNGIGILESFRTNDSPHYVQGMNHSQAIELALRPTVSSTSHLQTMYGGSENRGVGLSMIHSFMHQSKGIIFIGSGNAYYLQYGTNRPRIGVFPGGSGINGTLFSVAFCRGAMDRFLEMRRKAHQDMGLQQIRNIDNLIS